MKKYNGIYHSDIFVKDKASLATMCIYFDELHLVSPSDNLDDPTDYYKNIDGKLEGYYLNDNLPKPTSQLDKMNEFYNFIYEYKELIGEAIFFEKWLLNSAVNKGLNDGFALADLLLGKSPEIGALRKFEKLFPDSVDETSFRATTTSLSLAKENDWVLMGDDSANPIPVFSKKDQNARQLSSILASECLKIAIPKCRNANSYEILEIREKFKDELVCFRIMMQKLSKSLRAGLDSAVKLNDIVYESKFIVETEIEPIISEMKLRIEKEKSKIAHKVFGRVVTWIPLLTKFYVAPSPTDILAFVNKAYSDTSILIESMGELSNCNEKGVSFILNTQDYFDK